MCCVPQRAALGEGPGNRPYFNISYSKKYNPRYLQVCTIVCIIYDAHYRRSYLDLKRINVIILVLSRFTTKLKLKRRHFSPPLLPMKDALPVPEVRISVGMSSLPQRKSTPKEKVMQVFPHRANTMAGQSSWYTPGHSRVGRLENPDHFTNALDHAGYHTVQQFKNMFSVFVVLSLPEEHILKSSLFTYSNALGIRDTRTRSREAALGILTFFILLS